MAKKKDDQGHPNKKKQWAMRYSHNHLRDLRIVGNSADGRLDVVRCLRSLDQIRKEQIGMLQLHLWRNAAILPVVDALRASLFGVAEESGNFRGTSQALDELPVWVRDGIVRIHANIKHHV